MRPQLIAWLILGVLAGYVVMTVMERMQDGRCRSSGSDMECSFQKPRRIELPKSGGTLAALSRPPRA